VITAIRVPKLGMAMKKATVVHWLVAEGDAVSEGSDLLEILTEKVNAIVRAPASGILGRVVAAQGMTMPVGALLGLIGAKDDAFPSAVELRAAPAAEAAPVGAPAGVIAAGLASPSAMAGTAEGESPTASPSARRLAKELGVDLRLVPPSGIGRRITSEDVEAYAAKMPKGHLLPFEGIRAIVAENLTESLRTTAQVTVTREITVTGLVTRRAQLAAEFEAKGLHLTYTDLLIEVTAGLLKEQPVFNSMLTGAGVLVAEDIHIGFAVALDDGLIVPVIRDAGKLSLEEITRARADLGTRAAAGKLGLEDVEGGTFTITNLGAFGADAFTPIINPPQTAILGIGRIVERPVVVSGKVEVAPTMWLSLTFDHRVVDGAPAARFVKVLGDRLG
jgi:pyruvate dehydrogenase E2 component (dihydrolipoamide acetyltransferase)